MLLSSSPPLSSRGKVLVDGDIVAYRAAYSSDDGNEIDTQTKIDKLIDWIVRNCCYSSEVEDFEVYLTGDGNFRYDIATSYPYKGNRSAREKPKYLGYARWYLQDNYSAILSSDEEADDLIGIASSVEGPSCVVASIDKDMLQLPCYHFNFRTNVWQQVSEFEGLSFFYEQILTGDRADNIIGLHRVGPVKAKKILAECETEEDLWNAVVEAYDGNIERVVENARLLWLRREEGQLWQPPQEEPEQSKQGTGQD